MQFVRVDYRYLNELKKVDWRAPINDPALGKETKPFLGILFRQGEIEYFVPLSSPKQKHENMYNSRDFHKILDENGKLLSVINFNNMVPVTPALYKNIHFASDKDGALLRKEYAFCKKNAPSLSKKAQDLYERYKAGKLSPSEMKRTVDFSALESKLHSYLASTSSTTLLNQSTSSTASPQLLSIVSNMPRKTVSKDAQQQSVKKNENVNQ